jgi:hypothetical protein
MKRKDAFSKLRTICQRLDEADPATFFVIPKALYLFGSTLTDKPNPADLDLILDYQDRPDLDPRDIVARLSYGKPLPSQEAIIHLRRGMKMIRIELLEDGDLDQWRIGHGFLPDTPIKLVWQAGLNWPEIVDALEVNPLPWQPEREEEHKQLQKKVEHIRQSQGQYAAEKWREENVIKPMYGEGDSSSEEQRP